MKFDWCIPSAKFCWQLSTSEKKETWYVDKENWGWLTTIEIYIFPQEVLALKIVSKERYKEYDINDSILQTWRHYSL